MEPKDQLLQKNISFWIPSFWGTMLVFRSVWWCVLPIYFGWMDRNRMVVMIFIREVPKVKSSSRLSGVGACSKEHGHNSLGMRRNGRWVTNWLKQKQGRQKMFNASTCQTMNQPCTPNQTPRKICQKEMGVSKNAGTPKWMVYNGKPY